MSKGFKSLIVSSLLLLLTGLGSVRAETESTDSLPSVTAVSDSTLAQIARIISKQDTSLINTVFVEDVGIVMPGNKTVTGRAQIKKYLPLLLTKVGGGELSTTRTKMESIQDYTDLMREAGLFTLTRQVEGGTDYHQTGAYTIYWRLGEDGWFIERGFIGQR